MRVKKNGPNLDILEPRNVYNTIKSLWTEEEIQPPEDTDKKVPKVLPSLKALDLTRPPTNEELMAAGQLGDQLYYTYEIEDKEKEKKINLSFGEAIEAWNRHEYKKGSMGQKKVITSAEVFQFDINPPYLLSYARHSDSEGLHEQTVEMTRTQNGFDVILKLGGKTETRQVPQIDLTLADGLATEQWFKRNPEIGESITTRILDIRNVRTGTQTIKVLSRKSVIIDDVRMTYYEGSLSFSTMEHSEIIKVDSKGDTLSITLGGGLELRMEPEDLARSTEYRK
jgi:hypothetical protein